MSFSTEPKSGPSIVNPGTTASVSPPGQSPKERAMAAFMEPTAQAQQAAVQSQEQLPVKNANQVSAEELSAIQPNLGQDRSSEEPKDPQPSAEATKQPEDPLSSHYAQLARKERALRAKAQASEQALKAREAQVKAQEEALKLKEAQYQSGYIDKTKLQQDPLSVMNELGISYDQLTNLVLNAPKPEEIAQRQAYEKIQSEIKALRDAQEQAQKAVRDQQEQAYKQAVNQIRTEVKTLVNSDPEYSVIKSTNSVEDVVELIEKTFEKDGILLTVDEAAKEVEDFLTEEATRLYQIEKIKRRIEASSVKQPQAQKPPEQTVKQPQAPSKTLTNSVTSSKRMGAKERAIAAFNGQLKS